MRIRRLRRRLLGSKLVRDERGISLIMAMGILGVLSISAASVVFFANSGARSAQYAKNSDKAYKLAEAGVNRALAVLYNQNPLDPAVLPATAETLRSEERRVGKECRL